jgi:hypothetical protein
VIIRKPIPVERKASAANTAEATSVIAMAVLSAMR